MIKKRTLSLDEQAQLVRWDIEKELQLDVDEEALKFYFDGGLKKCVCLKPCSWMR